MSEYGPAAFISRVDGEPIPEDEQSNLLEVMQRIATELKITDPMEGEPSSPYVYDYDGYETRAIGFVLWADYAFGQAPEFVQEDMNADAASTGKKIGKKLETSHPGQYKVICYIVET